MDSLARFRDRRANAGARMAQMLEQEEDDFYKSTYGGFFDEDDDREYETEGSESDHVDSDFDCDENEQDEPIQGEEDDQSAAKRRNVPYKEKRTLVLKAAAASVS
jgi:vacuolar protein sorting-associated protein 72